MFCFISRKYQSSSSPQPLSNQWTRFANRLDQYPKTPEDLYVRLADHKAKVLLYKNNDAKFTAAIKYGLLAKGMSSSGKKSYASKSVGRESTEPNVGNYQRVNESLVNVTTGAPVSSTDIPTSCQGAFDQQPRRDPTFPIRAAIYASKHPIVPPLPPPPPTIPLPATSNILVIPISAIVKANASSKINQLVAIGGSLKCNATSNPCTGDIINEFTRNQCHPSSASNVPGNTILCSFPERPPANTSQSRKTYSSGNTKFPQNATLQGSVYS